MGFLDPKPQTTAGLDAAVRDKINQAGSATQVALNATYASTIALAAKADTTAVTAAVAPKANTVDVVPKWKATTAYLTGDRVISPSGDIVSAKVGFTSGATYSATNWTLSATFLPTAVPSYAGTRAKTWNASLSLYNGESPTLRKIRKLVADARAGRTLCDLVAAGDSKTVGYGTNGTTNTIVADSYPGQLIDLLGARERRIYAAKTSNDNDDTRWTLNTNFEKVVGAYFWLRSSSTLASTVTFTTTEKCIGLRIYGWNSSGSKTLTSTIDGGTPDVWTIPAGTQFNIKDYTGLADTVHTIKFDSTQQIAILAVEMLYAETTGLRISIAGRGGSKASQWLSTQNYLHPWATVIAGTNITTPNVVMLQLGTNWEASAVADLGTIVSELVGLNIPTLLVAPGAITNDTNFDSIRDAYYDLADTHDLPLLDFTSVVGNATKAASNGLVQDSLHENGRGYSLEASAVARVIAS